MEHLKVTLKAIKEIPSHMERDMEESFPKSKEGLEQTNYSQRNNTENVSKSQNKIMHTVEEEEEDRHEQASLIIKEGIDIEKEAVTEFPSPPIMLKPKLSDI